MARRWPGIGLKRQHRFTKTAVGWTETLATDGGQEQLAETDELNGLTESQLQQIRGGSARVLAPAEAQQEANEEAKAWHKQWGSELGAYDEVQWPADLGSLPPMLFIEAILQAANTFPAETGLGWDGLHPRVLNRVSTATLKWLAAILHWAEKHGRWQEAVEMVVIVLLPKPDGGFRPIGLLPWMVRV